VKDLAGNEIAADSTATGLVAGLTPGDINAPGVAGSIYSCKDGEFDMVAGGEDIWDEFDQGYAALKAVSGDFDVKVRLQSLAPADFVSKAGLMVRQTLDPGSPTLHLLANPPPPAGRGWIEGGRRAGRQRRHDKLGNQFHRGGDAERLGAAAADRRFLYGLLQR
jgi:hypothetical protein